MSPRIAILGDGKMGRLLAALAPERGCEVVAHLGPRQTGGGISRALLGGADVAIEFTVPTAAAGLVRACADAGVPVVSGTTGWDAERAAVEADVRASSGALLWAPNFAIGVHLFGKVVAEAARRFLAADAGFDAHFVEAHHAQKLDAPSGTARALAAAAEAASGRAIPITSVRVGHVPGTHELLFDAPYEQVRLVHEARDRRVFAAGALAAARWLVGRRGIFTLDDFLGEQAR
jgi:4-hydroxy-tetrahydrodipicolinate reductase